jgi:hypothetical protein
MQDKNDPVVQRAMQVGEQILGQITAALDNKTQ